MRTGGRAIWIVAVVGLAALLPGCGEKAETGGTPATASAPDMVAAMKAVFPEADAKGDVSVPVGPDGAARVERPVTVVAGEGGRSYLVTAKERQDGCHACSAQVSVYYLKGADGSLSVVAKHPDLFESGGWGEAGDIKPLALPRNGGVGITDESGFTAQGCTVTNVSVYRFDEKGPKALLEGAPLSVTYEAIDIAGTIIKPFTADADFAVNYVGNNASVPVDTTVTWQVQDGALVQNSGRVPDAVAAGC